MQQSRRLMLVVAALAVSWGHTRSDAASPRDRRFASAKRGIVVEAPPGWTLSEHTGYQETVVLLLHPDGSRISVTAAPTEARDAATLAEANKRGLSAQGLSLSRTVAGQRDSVVVDAVAPSRREALRQAYLVRSVPSGRQAVVLTLVCRAAALATHAAALDFALARLVFEPPSEPTTGSRANGRGGGGTGTIRGPTGGSTGQLRASDTDRDPAPQQLPNR